MKKRRRYPIPARCELLDGNSRFRMASAPSVVLGVLRIVRIAFHVDPWPGAMSSDLAQPDRLAVYRNGSTAPESASDLAAVRLAHGDHIVCEFDFLSPMPAGTKVYGALICEDA